MNEVIIRAKAGDEKALAEILEQYKSKVRAVANRFYLVGGDKDDLLQEGTVGLLKAVYGYDESKGNFNSYAELCVTRAILSAIRKSTTDKNKLLAEAISIDNVEIVDEKEDPLQSLIEKELRFQIENAIETLLSRTEKQVITLFIEGYSYAEIEKATGKSYKAIDGALQRAKKKLSFIKE